MKYFLQKLLKKHTSGQTLLEAIIAIGVLMVGVLGSLVLVNTTINLGRQNQDRLVAQNLAREGLEIAYSLRGSASLLHSQVPSTVWDSYLLDKTPIDKTTYDSKYDIGVYSDLAGGGDGTCYQRCSTGGVAGCLSQSGGLAKDGVTVIPGSAYNDSTGSSETDIACDEAALSKYLSGEFKQLPPFCDNTNPTQFLGAGEHKYWDGLTPATSRCNFNGGSSSVVDLSDLSQLVSDVFNLSNHFVNAYPTVSVNGQVSSGYINGTDFTFYVPPGNAPPVDLLTVWKDNRARVYLYNGTYVQNSSAGLVPTPTGTKYYRVVTLQEVCRDSGGNEVVLDQTNAYNCQAAKDSSVNRRFLWLRRWKEETGTPRIC